MFLSLGRAAVIFCILAMLAAAPSAQAAQPALDASVVNRGVVELETGGADIAAHMAEDIAGIVDDGATRRLVPVIGKGPLQNLADLRYLRGIDLAIVQSDALDYAREKRFLPGIETSLSYVAKLYNAEFHLLARGDIKSISELADQKVNIGLRGSGTALTAARLFDLLKLNVVVTNDSQDVALQHLRSGQIAALGFVAAKPAPFFQTLKANDGFHLISIPLSPAVAAQYAPTRITAADYPDLVRPDQPADSVAIGNVLMAADLRMIPERFRNVTNFVEALFTGFPTLLEPGRHPKWREVNIAAEFSGWQRHPAAEQWLQRNLQVAAPPNPDVLKALFSQFVDERRLASGGAPMSSEEKDRLFQQFRSWQRGQAR